MSDRACYIQAQHHQPLGQQTTSPTASAAAQSQPLKKKDPLAKLYDNAVLKIPKVIPSDNESLYSECNSYRQSTTTSTSSGKKSSRPSQANSLDSKRHRLMQQQTKKQRHLPSPSRGTSKAGGGGHFSESDHNYDLDDDEMHGENSYESIKCVGEEATVATTPSAVAPDGVYVNNFLTMGRWGAT